MDHLEIPTPDMGNKCDGFTGSNKKSNRSKRSSNMNISQFSVEVNPRPTVSKHNSSNQVPQNMSINSCPSQKENQSIQII